MSMLNKKRRQILTQVATLHRSNIQKRLRHRLEVARAKGDEKLVRILEAEANYFN